MSSSRYAASSGRSALSDKRSEASPAEAAIFLLLAPRPQPARLSIASVARMSLAARLSARGGSKRGVLSVSFAKFWLAVCSRRIPRAQHLYTLHDTPFVRESIVVNSNRRLRFAFGFHDFHKIWYLPRAICTPSPSERCRSMLRARPRASRLEQDAGAAQDQPPRFHAHGARSPPF